MPFDLRLKVRWLYPRYVVLFTRLGRVVAFLALLSGIWMVVGGLLIATGVLGSEDVALVRFFGSKPSTGAVIDRGFYTAIFGIALGILTEISYGVRGK